MSLDTTLVQNSPSLLAHSSTIFFYYTLQKCEGFGDICVNQYSHLRTIHLNLQIHQTHVRTVHREQDIATSIWH